MSQGTTAVSKRPPAELDQAKAYFEHAVTLIKAKRFSEASPVLQRVLKILPQHANTYQLLSVIASEQGNLDLSLKHVNSAILYQNNNPEFLYNRAMLYQRLNKSKLAMLDLQQCLRINSSNAVAHHALGRIYHALKQYKEAVSHYEECLKTVNTDTDLWEDLSNAYFAEANYSKALHALELSVHFDQDNVQKLIRLGSLAQKTGKQDRLIEAYTKVLELSPDKLELLTPLFLSKNKICNWDNYDASLQVFNQDIALAVDNKSPLHVSTFEALSLPNTPEMYYRIASCESGYLTSKFSIKTKKPVFKLRPHANDRLRIAYLSSSFRDFPTGHLTQDLYGLHDRKQFEVFAYSYGTNDQSSIRKKIEQSCDHFIDIHEQSIQQSAQQIYNDKIDILIDLMGASSGARLEINALRPVPITVRYLGVPVTSGARYFDYFISDSFLSPPEAQAHFSEHLVLMPHSYQVNPVEQPVANTIPSRKDCGLPEKGIVLCAFNNTYKLEPVIFQVWMSILQEVPEAVLWLQGTGSTKDNLIKEAAKYGIAAERLIFAARVPKDQHLARHAHADLYLDTYFYNAHTTASDALWMNIPILTCPGSTFQSRVAGSLLRAMALDELIMPDLASYQKTAVDLAKNPQALQALKDKVRQKRTSTPLFDTKRFVANLEKAYLQMWENYKNHKKTLIEVIE